MHVSWEPVENTEFYIVRYGVAPDRLFGSYQVYHDASIDINSLNSNTEYYVSVDTANSTAVTKGQRVILVR